MRLSAIEEFCRKSFAVGLLVCVSACGGGGGGGSPNPVLGKLSFTTNENVALNTSVTATDPGGGQITFSQAGNPTSGTVSGFTPAGGFTYTPNPNFTGNDSFAIQATDAAGNKTAGTVTITVTVNKPPTASGAVMRADGTGLSDINVLQSANDPDKDPLTVTIIDQPPTGAGTATVNSDGTVSVSGLSGFKGLTHFTYQVTDPSGAKATGAAAVFVGTDPFRAAFVGDAAGNGSNEVYLTDFATDPVAMTAATQGNLRLKGFAIADNGATIVYRVEDKTAPATTSLAFVKTAAPTQATAVPLPSGTVPVLDSNNRDQFVVSPDGQWIAVIAGQGNSNALYVINIAQPTVVSQVQPAGAVYAAQPTFSLDSKNMYFLATTVAGGAHKSLYYASLSSPGQTTLMSKLSDTASVADDVSAYSVSPDLNRILLQAIRGGKAGIYFVNAQAPAVENQLDEAVPAQAVGATTIGLPIGKGGSTTVSRVVYEVEGTDSSTHPLGIYVADVSSTPNPRLAVQNSGAHVLGLRPDDKAFLYTDGAQVFEAVIDAAGSQSVGGGYSGWYDSTGSIVLLTQHLPYQALASTSRGAFGTTNQIGTTSLAVLYSDVSGFDRGVTVIGQGPTSGTPPTTSALQLVNALAPRGLLSLASFQSPLQLTSYSSKIVSK
ncbi:MAG: Ig-like domain-containing protein [Steroidobacteraceae bacterium]